MKGNMGGCLLKYPEMIFALLIPCSKQDSVCKAFFYFVMGNSSRRVLQLNITQIKGGAREQIGPRSRDRLEDDDIQLTVEGHLRPQPKISIGILSCSYR
jgi:hypothetical protein